MAKTSLNTVVLSLQVSVLAKGLSVIGKEPSFLCGLKQQCSSMASPLFLDFFINEILTLTLNTLKCI